MQSVGKTEIIPIIFFYIEFIGLYMYKPAYKGSYKDLFLKIKFYGLLFPLLKPRILVRNSDTCSGKDL